MNPPRLESDRLAAEGLKSGVIPDCDGPRLTIDEKNGSDTTKAPSGNDWSWNLTLFLAWLLCMQDIEPDVKLLECPYNPEPVSMILMPDILQDGPADLTILIQKQIVWYRIISLAPTICGWNTAKEKLLIRFKMDKWFFKDKRSYWYES